MGKFDNLNDLWGDITLDDIDVSNYDFDDLEANDVRAAKKATQTVNKQDYEQNIDMDYDKFLDYDNPEGDQSVDQTTSWRKLINHYEQNFKRMWAKRADEFNYEMNNFKNKQVDLQNSSLDKFMQLKNHNKLIELNAKRQDLMDWAKGMIKDIDYSKGRASGFITNNNIDFYLEHPEAVRNELATGKYEYKPTSIK